MPELLEKLKENILSNVISKILGLLLSAFLLFLAYRVFPVLWGLLVQIPQTITLIICIILSIFLIICLTYCFILLRKNKLKPRFGLYWDKNKNPYCPICKKLISTSYYDNKPLDPYFICLKCDIIIRLRDERGNQMHFYQAVDLLDVKKITPNLIEKSKQKGKQPL